MAKFTSVLKGPLMSIAFLHSASAAVIEVGPCDGNATPAAVTAAARLRDGDTLRYSDWSEGVVWETRNADIPNNGLQHTLRMIPNPATENVSLFSDCLINGVDVYRSDGARQLSLACQDHSAGFSVKDWPKGMYIVVAHTTQGDITKKLMVE